MIMPYEYPVNWDALILLYQGTTSQFIELKFLVEKWPFLEFLFNKSTRSSLI